MSEIRKDIRLALKEHLSGNSEAGERVFVNRKVSLEEGQEYPAILIYSGPETPQRVTFSGQVYTRSYSVHVEIRHSISSLEEEDEPIDDRMDDIATEIEARMKSFKKDKVIAFVYAGSEPAIDDDGDTIMGSLKLTYDFTYIL